MTTKTDFHSIMELRDKYTPAKRGIVNGAEAETINSVLEIKERSNIEIQNIRDMVVILYGQWSDKMREKYKRGQDNESFDRSMEYMDAMSAICCVIDNEKLNRGLEV